ncbi:hypothetical protein DB346_18895 [Verrucomicrobia bacterium LW23]|nr:hypothetical protein DB346_18895 [Verrucomicrobia bacterium LW23]
MPDITHFAQQDSSREVTVEVVEEIERKAMRRAAWAVVWKMGVSLMVGLPIAIAVAWPIVTAVTGMLFPEFGKDAGPGGGLGPGLIIVPFVLVSWAVISLALYPFAVLGAYLLILGVPALCKWLWKMVPRRAM